MADKKDIFGDSTSYKHIIAHGIRFD